MSGLYIKQWDYIPKKFEFHRVAYEEELYMGVELEVDNGGELEGSAHKVMMMFNDESDGSQNVYCKHDGSLSQGFEIVTHPCTLEYHKTLPYEKVFTWLTEEKNYRSHNTSTCGMHVHVNRTYFGGNKLDQDFGISKLLYLFEKYWDKVELIARRGSNQYARRFLLEEDETPIDLYAKSQSSDKYGAVNLKHKDTVEIRIFKGTLNYDTYISTLEFVNVMTKIAKETDIYQIQFVTWDKISERFPDKLKEYVAERERIKEENKKNTNHKYGRLDLENGSSIRSISNSEDSFPVSEPRYFMSNRRGSRIGQGIVDYYMERWNDLRESFGREQAADQHYRDSLEDIESWLSWLSCGTLNTTELNRTESRTEEECLEREIANMRQLERRSRNELERINIRRQIAEKENELRRMRLRSRVVSA